MSKKAANLFQRGEIWYFRKKLAGTTRRLAVSTGCKDLNQAKRRKVELEKEFNDDAFGWKKKVVAPAVVDWMRECVKVYGPAMKGRAFTHAMALGEQFWTESVAELPERMGEVIPKHCTLFLNWMADKGFAQNTTRARAGYLRLVWNHAIAAGLVTKNPWKGLKLPRKQPRRRVLKPHEQPKLLTHLKPVWQRATEFDILTGLRHDELVKLVDEDIDFVRRQVHVRAGKGSKQRYVPLSPEAAVIARIQMTARDAGTMGVRLLPPTRKRIEEGRVFPFSAGVFLAVVQRAALAAKLDSGVTVHDLRRTFGTRCAMSGVPMKKLQLWMGHASINTTAEFYVVVDENRNTDIDLMAGLRASVVAAKEETTEATKVATA